MKKYLKEILPAGILAFVTCFMLLIYEPIMMYASNTSDFWFDVYTLLACNSIAFIVGFAIIFGLYNIVYWITIKFLKDKKFLKNIYIGSLALGFVLFITTYIQGNYLVSKLPVLDGTPIPWNNYKGLSVISFVMLIIVGGIVSFSIKKYKEKAIKFFSFVTCAILVMLSVSMLSTIMTKKDCLKRKEYTVMATTTNINRYSNKKNFVIFMVDAVDSETAKKVLDENADLKQALADFTYYPDTMGGYSFTRDSVPLVLSGCWNENKTDWATFYNEAMDKSELLKLLKEKKYNINIYDNEIPYNTENAWEIKNFSFDNKVDKFAFIKQELKYDMFKYAPYYLKKFSKIETMDYNSTRKENNDTQIRFLWDNKVFFHDYVQQKIEKVNDNEFKFIHLEGAHSPFDVDKDLNDKEGTYEDKVAASMNVIRKYIDVLKENGVYDNTAIIIMADHGWLFEIEPEGLLQRQNPIFYIKGFNDKHDEMIVSEEKVSFDYLQDIYKELLNEKPTNQIFDNIDNEKPRRYLLQLVYGYDKMEEYLQYGHSKDLNTIEKTGNIYER